jgi:hypothetical protein
MNDNHRRYSFAKCFGWNVSHFLLYLHWLTLSPAQAAVTSVTAPIRIALTDTPAPTDGSDSAIYISMGIPTLNSTGQVAFRSSIYGSNESEGIFAGYPGAIQSVAMLGGSSPMGGDYTDFYSDQPSLNSAGQLAFSARAGGAFGTLVGAPGALQTAFVSGATSPSGGTFGSLYPNSQLLNASGQVAFYSRLNDSPYNAGLFVGTPGALQTVALEGTATQGGNTFATIDNFPRFNAAGQVAFFSSLTGGTSTSGLFLGSPGNVQAVALRGTPAPSGGVFNNVSRYDLNSVGQVAFISDVSNDTGNRTAIFTGAPNALQVVAGLDKQPSGNIGQLALDSTSLAFNAAGQVAFASTLGNGTSTSGIFVVSTSSIQAVALQGTPAPGGGTFRRFSNPSLNGVGQVAFLADLTGAGINALNDKALYAGTPDALVEVIRKGEYIDVDPGSAVDLRPVRDIEFFISGTGENGRPTGFNDNGMLAYKLNLGIEQGIFTSQITTIPEPNTIVFSIIVLSIVTLRWYRCQPHTQLRGPDQHAGT